MSTFASVGTSNTCRSSTPPTASALSATPEAGAATGLMGYRWVDHTAELELRVDAATETGVFESALAALAELLRDGASHERVSFDVAIGAADRATLLAGWLDELVFRAETEGLVPDAVERLMLEADGLQATVQAHRGRPRHLVKGVTYHRLSFDEVDGGYRATVVLDV